MISHIDHLVLTVRSLDATCAFYERVLGFTRSDSPGRPTALHFGTCKFNVHEVDHTFEPKADVPTPGSTDLCLISDWTVEAILHHLEAEQVPVLVGPVERNGAQGAMASVYLRDPDGNLIEISRYGS